jgi:transposase InsO family protein
MPWQECDAMSLRREFCRLASVEDANLSRLCERFSISRKTGYKWLTRYRQSGDEGLAEQSRRPRQVHQATSAEMEARVLALRDKHPAWGGRKLRARLQHLGCEQVPAASTITAILRRHGRILPEESLKRQAFERFEHPEPNDLWQMDFKGEFRLTDGSYCHPLTVLDDHSRYSLVLEACPNERREGVRTHLIAAFRRYGLPWRMLMDNGPPWGTPVAPGGLSELKVWLMDLDIAVTHGRPHHPQTQGKEERFHRTLKQEVLQGRSFASHEHAQRGFEAWRPVYNYERPHEALGMRTPSTRYRVSERAYPERIAPHEYDSSFVVRKIGVQGRLNLGGRYYYLSRAFTGRWVAARRTDREGEWAVYYRSFPVAKLQEQAGHPRPRERRGAVQSLRSLQPHAAQTKSVTDVSEHL